MTTANERVSFLIPVYNAKPDWLRRCINSIQSQSYKEWNAVFVNDGSDEYNVWEQLINYSELDKRLRCITIPHSGVAIALNEGLKLCDELVARLDSDDYSHWQRLEHQVPYLLNYNYDLIGGSMHFMDHGETHAYQGDILNRLRQKMTPSWHSTWLFRKSSLREYEIDYPWGEDFATLCRMYMEGKKIGNCPQMVTYKRQHKERASVIYRQQQIESTDRALKDFIHG